VAEIHDFSESAKRACAIFDGERMGLSPRKYNGTPEKYKSHNI
jgi:hypothetical protein